MRRLRTSSLLVVFSLAPRPGPTPPPPRACPFSCPDVRGCIYILCIWWADKNDAIEFEEPLKPPPRGLKWHQLDDQEWELRTVKNTPPVQQDAEDDPEDEDKDEDEDSDNEEEEDDEEEGEETADAGKGKGEGAGCAVTARQPFPLTDRPTDVQWRRCSSVGNARPHATEPAK